MYCWYLVFDSKNALYKLQYYADMCCHLNTLTVYISNWWTMTLPCLVLIWMFGSLYKTNFTTKKSTSIRKTCSIDIRKRSNLMENSPGWVRRSIVPGCYYIWSLSVFARMLKFHINFTNVFKCNSTSGIWALLKTSMNTSLRISLKISMKTHVCFNVWNILWTF